MDTSAIARATAAALLLALLAGCASATYRGPDRDAPGRPFGSTPAGGEKYPLHSPGVR